MDSRYRVIRMGTRLRAMERTTLATPYPSAETQLQRSFCGSATEPGVSRNDYRHRVALHSSPRRIHVGMYRIAHRNAARRICCTAPHCQPLLRRKTSRFAFISARKGIGRYCGGGRQRDG